MKPAAIGPHQFLRRGTGAVIDEHLFADRIVGFLYSAARERAPSLFRALTSQRASRLLGLANFDLPLSRRLAGSARFLSRSGLNLDECLEAPRAFRTPRQLFERKIRYWECRPMASDPAIAVSPADSRVLVGSFDTCSAIFAKGKFFELEELLGPFKPHWLRAFRQGAFAVCRLTPELYHYNHTPVAGKVLDFYEIDGCYHSCNPAAVVAIATPYSKNRRTVTIIDTDVPGGTGIGLVAMVEIAALMIGGIIQCYSERRYDAPRPVEAGLLLQRGCPKSLYQPGSSTDVVIFQHRRTVFAPDLLRNQRS